MISATALASSIAACNALTGVSDLTPCDDCGGTGAPMPDGATDSTGRSDGRVIPGPEDGAAPDGDLDAAGNDGDAGRIDAADAAPIGCQGAVDCTRVVFVSSQSYTGNLGGIAGADAKCQALADVSPNARIKNHTFQAWVSTLASSAAMRFVHGSQPYVLSDATVIAADWNDLTKGTLSAGISIDELNQPQDGRGAWTATDSSGAAYAGLGCESFTNGNAGGGVYGNVAGSGGGWSSTSADPCTKQNALYCFEK